MLESIKGFFSTLYYGSPTSDTSEDIQIAPIAPIVPISLPATIHPSLYEEVSLLSNKGSKEVATFEDPEILMPQVHIPEEVSIADEMEVLEEIATPEVQNAELVAILDGSNFYYTYEMGDGE